MREPFEKARDAMCDLSAAYSIIAICEGGIFRTPRGQRFADRLVRLCKEHASTQLNDHDRNRP